MWCRSRHAHALLLRCMLELPASRTSSTSLSAPPLPVEMSSTREKHQPIRQKVVKNVESIQGGRKKIKVRPAPAKMKSQSYMMPGPERIRVSGASEHPWKFVEHLDDTTRTVCDVLQVGMKKSSSGDCLGHRFPLETGKYKWISYSEVAQRKDYIGSGLMSLGIKPKHRAMVGISTRTRPEFVLVMMACSRYSMVMVPLFHCYSRETQSYIIDHVKMEAIFCENPQFASNIIENSSHYPSLKHIIVFDGEESEIADLKTNSKFNIYSMKDLEIRGKMKLERPNKPTAEDLFCVCFTSGTTGTPKGVMLTHKNLLSCIASLDTVLGDTKPMYRVLMCYLPCAHVYEIINEVFALYHGGRLGYYSGKTDSLLSDITELKPSVLPLVPKLMNYIYAGAQKKMGHNWIRRALFNISCHQKERTLKKGVVSRTSVWDKMVFSKLQQHLGGSIELIFTASAPVSKEVLRFFRCGMGCLVFEVYGLSEVGAAAMTLLSEHDCGFVGPPLPCNHIKLTSVPEMAYYAENDEGEICIRGLNVFSGYYNNHEATAEALDADGWYHTGDIGKWLPNGALSIFDRKKHIFKIAQGEYIVPERVEAAYRRSPLISQVFVDGQSDKEFIFAIVVPEKNEFVQWAREEGFKEDYKALCQSEEVKRAMLKHLVAIGKEAKLNSLQQAGNVFISEEHFSQENDLITPTMKLKRGVARKYFEKEIEKLYKEGNLRKQL